MQEHRADTRNLREAGSLQAGGRQTDFHSTLQAAGRALGPASAPVGTVTVVPGYSTVWGCCELAGHLIALSPGMGWAELWMAQPRWFVHCNKYSSERVTFLISNGFISPPKLTTPLCVTVSFADEETDSEKGGAGRWHTDPTTPLCWSLARYAHLLNRFWWKLYTELATNGGCQAIVIP